MGDCVLISCFCWKISEAFLVIDRFKDGHRKETRPQRPIWLMLHENGTQIPEIEPWIFS